MRLEDLTAKDLPGDQSELAECIGMEAYIQLVRTFGGCDIHVCKQDTLLLQERNRQICEEFDGANYRRLALRYGLSERSIREITSRERTRLREEPLPEQLTFYENIDDIGDFA